MFELAVPMGEALPTYWQAAAKGGNSGS